jgi:hypothetical protein
LEDKDAIVVKEIVHLAEEGSVAANTNMLQGNGNKANEKIQRANLGHFQTDNLGVVAGTSRDVAVVQAENASTFWVTAIGQNTFISELGLVPAESDSSHFTAVVFVGKCCEGAPPTSDIKKAISGLKIELLADNSELVVLELLESLGFGKGSHYARCVDHAGT